MLGWSMRRCDKVRTGAGFLVLLLGLCWPIRKLAADTNAQGLLLTIEGVGANKSVLPDARIARLVALYVPHDQPPSDFTPAGPFRATFEGDLNLRLRDTYTFFAEGRGKFTLSFNGKLALESSGEDLSQKKSQPIRLNKGKNHLVAIYESPQVGDAALRLFWSGRSFQPEPPNPALLTRSADTEGVSQSLKRREGRFLFAQFRCEKCHTSADNAMPELAMDAPSLADAGSRLNEAWLAAWISNPKSLRPDAQMPRLFHSSRGDSGAEDIAAYLVTLGKPAPAVTTGDAKAGGRLFANLDCIACHTLPDEKDDPGRVRLTHVKAKLGRDALRQYLLKPEAHYAWNPMPNSHLSDSEAADLCAFLLSLPATDLPQTSHGDSAKGKRLVESVGCLNCHTMGDVISTAKAAPLSAVTGDRLNRGCLATTATARGNAPDFALTTEEREALEDFLATDRSSLKLRCASEIAERQILAMRCTACHARDGSESLLVQGLDGPVQALHEKYPNPPAKEGETWAADQRPPMLTWAGEKLRPDWMRNSLPVN